MISVDDDKMDPTMRAVLDWLVRHEARVYDFAEVADQAGLKRGDVETALRRLRHQRADNALPSVGPDGGPLEDRKAYLPADSAHRRGHPSPVAVPRRMLSPLEERAIRRREKEARQHAAMKAAEDAELAAKAEVKRVEKEARREAQERIRASRQMPTEAPPVSAVRPTPKQAPKITQKPQGGDHG